MVKKIAFIVLGLFVGVIMGIYLFISFSETRMFRNFEDIYQFSFDGRNVVIQKDVRGEDIALKVDGSLRPTESFITKDQKSYLCVVGSPLLHNGEEVVVYDSSLIDEGIWIYVVDSDKEYYLNYPNGILYDKKYYSSVDFSKEDVDLLLSSFTKVAAFDINKYQFMDFVYRYRYYDQTLDTFYEEDTSIAYEIRNDGVYIVSRYHYKNKQEVVNYYKISEKEFKVFCLKVEEMIGLKS
ncbi:MAG: hypothetical protein WBO70_03935 [Erysipelotrichaceae bacterium]